MKLRLNRSALLHCAAAGALAWGLIALILHFRADYLSRPRTLLAVMRSAPAVTLHEGLPHQYWERKALASERQSKPTIRVHESDFYDAIVSISADDDAALRRVFEEKGTFREWSGHKLCGGFHADWLLEWKASDGTGCEMLLCFGCDEAKVWGPNGMSHYDLSSSASEALEVILRKR